MSNENCGFRGSLKCHEKVQKIVKKTKGMLAFIYKELEYRDTDVMLQLYRTLVRPQLEYCEQVSASHLRKDVLALERVQHRFRRMIPGLQGLSYDERLDKLGIYSLKFKRWRDDLIDIYKLFTGNDRVDKDKLFPLVQGSRTRGQNLKIRAKPFRRDC